MTIIIKINEGYVAELFLHQIDSSAVKHPINSEEHETPLAQRTTKHVVLIEFYLGYGSIEGITCA